MIILAVAGALDWCIEVRFFMKRSKPAIERMSLEVIKLLVSMETIISACAMNLCGLCPFKGSNFYYCSHDGAWYALGQSLRRM